MRWRSRAKNPEEYAEHVGAVPSLTADLDAWSAYIPVGPSRDGPCPAHESDIRLFAVEGVEGVGASLAG